MRRGNEIHHIPDGHIDWVEATSILVVYCMAKAFLAAPERAARLGQTAGWSMPIVSSAMSLAWLLPLVAVLRSHPGLNVIQAAWSLGGPLVSVPAGLFLALYHGALVSVHGRELSAAITSIVLPTTPEHVLLGLGAAVVSIIVFHGLEVMGRVCTIALFLVSILTLILAALGMPYWDLNGLFPALGPGLPRLVSGWITYQSAFGELFAIGLLAPYLRKPEHLSKSVSWSLALSGSALLISVTAGLLVFPYPTVVRLPRPFIRTIRLIQLGRFFQRLDAVFLGAWLTTGILAAAAGLYITVISLATTLSLKSYRPLIIPVAAVLLAGAILVPDASTAIVLHYDVLRPYATIGLASWSLALFLLERRKARRRGEGGS